MSRPAACITAAQCAALLTALKAGPVTTYNARDRLGIASPAARVLDLRKAGHRIVSDGGTDLDSAGRTHRCAVYRLDIEA